MYLQMWGPWKIFFMHAGMRRLDKSKPSGVGVRPEDGVDHHVLWTVRWGYFGTKAQKHKYLGYGGGGVCERDQAFDQDLELEAECIGEGTGDVHNVPSSGAETRVQQDVEDTVPVCSKHRKRSPGDKDVCRGYERTSRRSKMLGAGVLFGDDCLRLFPVLKVFLIQNLFIVFLQARGCGRIRMERPSSYNMAPDTVFQYD